MSLPGVKVGPLDPDATSGFGQVAARNSARQLIRLHRQMYPAALKRALVRPRDDARSSTLDHEEVAAYVGGLTHPNGDPVLPDGARVVPGSAAVRGDRRAGQVLTFAYELESGRVGKWYAPYLPEHLPQSHEAGEEAARIAQLREQGLVAYDSEGTRVEILQRHNAELRREVNSLREFVHSGGEGEPPASGAAVDTRDQANIADENERLGREVQELRERLGQYEALQAAQGGGVPMGGVGETLPPSDTVASADEPVEGYDALNADQAKKLLCDESTDNETRQRILEYERTHANRSTVVAAGEKALGTGGENG